MSKGFNQKKTNPSLVKYGYYDGIAHAECYSLLKASKGDTLIVVRILKNNSISCSKPCKRCIKFCKDFGIKKILYIDWEENMRELKL
jgi:deoxycytidylate deaminase